MNTAVMKSLDRAIIESSQSSNMLIIYKIGGKTKFFFYLDGERERTIYTQSRILGSRS